MKVAWLVLLVCAACKGETKEETRESPPSPSPSPQADKPSQRGSGSLAENGPHADYPTAAAAGTDKIFLLEEPDRGPRAPASYAMPPRGQLAWTTAPYCELDELGPRCSKGAGTWQIGRRKGVTIVEEHRAGGSIAKTTVYIEAADGTLAQRLELDAYGAVDEALIVSQPGRFTGRMRDGSNALPGCGMRAFTLDAQKRIAELRCLQWLGEPMRDKTGVALLKIARDERGFIAATTRFGADGAALNDITGVHRIAYERDRDGRVLVSRRFDAAGQRVIDTHGCAGEKLEYTSAHEIARRSCLDTTDGPVLDGDGVARRVYTYDARGCMKSERYFAGGDGKATDHDQVHGFDYERDRNCAMLAHTCIGVEGAAVACGPDRPARQLHERDARGFEVSIKNFAPDGTPTLDSSYKSHELRNVYDAAGNKIEQACFDERGTPIECASTGFHGVRTTYDDAGRAIVETFFDTRRSPATNLGTAQRKTRYDNYDHAAEARAFDASGVAIEVEGMALRTNLWDATHRLFAIKLFDKNNQPARFGACYVGATCPETPWHAVRINRRPNGTTLANQFFDADGQLIATIDCTAKPCFD